MDQWIEHPNVTAVILGHLPGQDSGRGLAEILFGKVSPSGKLPYTLAKNESDYEALAPDVGEGKYKNYPQSDFAESIFIDYRHFDHNDIEPRFEFGFGLSYTTFEYSDLEITILSNNCTRPGPPPKRKTLPGGNPAIWKKIVRVTANIRNTGSDFEGAEAAQLYIGIPGDDNPIRQLRGFDKVTLAPGEVGAVEFELTRKDLSVWDVVKQDWVLREGEYKVYVGSSSRKLHLEGEFEV